MTLGRLLMGLALLAAAGVLPAWSAQRVPRIGLVWNSLPQADLDRGRTAHPGPKSIEDGLRKLGWQPGKNLELISKSAESRYERMPAIIDEMVRMPVDVIVVFGPEAAAAAKDRTQTIPIVWSGSFVLGPQARPQGNVTGVTFVVGSLDLKRLEILKTLAPDTTRVAIFVKVLPGEARTPLPARANEAARTMGLELLPIFFESPEDLDQSFEDAKRQRANAVHMPIFPELTWSQPVRSNVLRLAAHHKLPTAYAVPTLAQAGGLVAYGPDDNAANRRAPYFIDRILRGAKVSELPIETVTKVDLNINRRVARQLGLEIPASLLIQADNVFD